MSETGTLYIGGVDPEKERCLRCGSWYLDTGWECNDCGYDNMPHYVPPKEPSQAMTTETIPEVVAAMHVASPQCSNFANRITAALEQQHRAVDDAMVTRAAKAWNAHFKAHFAASANECMRAALTAALAGDKP